MEYYNPQKLLSYNAYFNFIMGGRGIGKTFSYKKFCLNKFIKEKAQFIYLRRTQAELDNLDKEKFFPTELLKQVFDNFTPIEGTTKRNGYKLTFACKNLKRDEHTLEITGRKISLDKEIICYMKSLSTSIQLKGSEYDQVKYILFDEALLDKNAQYQRYLKNEIENLFQFISSVFRNRNNTKIFLLSNATSPNNPYFAYFNFIPKEKERFTYLKNFNALFEICPAMKEEEIKELQEDNNFMKLIHKSDIIKSNYKNEFQIETNNNVKKLPGIKTFLYTFYCKGKYASCFSYSGVIYIKEGKCGEEKIILSFNIEDIEKGYTFIPSTHPIAKALKNHFFNNIIFYENLSIKFRFINSLQRIL